MGCNTSHIIPEEEFNFDSLIIKKDDGFVSYYNSLHPNEIEIVPLTRNSSFIGEIFYK